MFVTEIFQNSGKDHRGAAGPDTEVSVIGIRYTSGRRGNVRLTGLKFSDLSVAIR